VTAIYLVAVGSVDEEILAGIEVCLWQAFGFATRRLSPLGDPAPAYDPQRQQYSVIAIMKDLLKQCPADAIRLLAITERDLFIPMLSFVFGQAQLRGKIAIVSLARLRQEFYGLPANPVLFISRVFKETVHEMGHTFGLTHCLDRECPMSLSTNIQQVDAKGEAFCANCAILLRERLVQFSDKLRAEVPQSETT
jgi:archaemetzincin